MPLHVSSTCANHQEIKIALHSLWYHHTYRCIYWLTQVCLVLQKTGNVQLGNTETCSCNHCFCGKSISIIRSECLYTCLSYRACEAHGQSGHSLWYHHTYSCDDTRGCVIQFWSPDDEYICSKHVEAWNKLIVKQKFCALNWLITEINILRCTVSKT